MRDIKRAWSPRFGIWMQEIRKEFGMTPKCGKSMEGGRGEISEGIVEMMRDGEQTQPRGL